MVELEGSNFLPIWLYIEEISGKFRILSHEFSHRIVEVLWSYGNSISLPDGS